MDGKDGIREFLASRRAKLTPEQAATTSDVAMETEELWTDSP